MTHHVSTCADFAFERVAGRRWGFTLDVFDSPVTSESLDPQVRAGLIRDLAAADPHIVEVATGADHEGVSVVGSGCDDQFEFEFALDLLLDGFERLHQQGWSSARRPTRRGWQWLEPARDFR